VHLRSNPPVHRRGCTTATPAKGSGDIGGVGDTTTKTEEETRSRLPTSNVDQAMAIEFAEVLLLHIRNLVNEKSFGCLMGFADNHDLCNDTAMSLMSQVEIENYVDEKRAATPALAMEPCPLKAHYLVKPRRKQLIDVILSLC
jgi:hypothetical protein